MFLDDSLSERSSSSHSRFDEADGSLMASAHFLRANSSSIDMMPLPSEADTAEQGVKPEGEILSARRPPSPMITTGIRSSKLELRQFSAFVESRLSSNNNKDATSNGSAILYGSVNGAESHLFAHTGPPPPGLRLPLETIDIRVVYEMFPEDRGGLEELSDRGPSDAFFLVKIWVYLNAGNITEDNHAFYGTTTR